MLAISLGSLSVEGTSIPTLLEQSPFIPQGFSPPESNVQRRDTRTTQNVYEFKGVYELGGKYRFLVKATQAPAGKWVESGKNYEDFEIRGYDKEQQILTLVHNQKEEQLELAELEANPTPMPVSGQPATRPVAATANETAARRVVQPPTRPSTGRSSANSPPPPAWLQKLRQEAAERRGTSSGSTSGVANPAVGSTGSRNDIPAPPTYKPPTPPPSLTESNIPPPPTGMPPEPPPEIMEQIRQSLSTRPGT